MRVILNKYDSKFKYFIFDNEGKYLEKGEGVRDEKIDLKKTPNSLPSSSLASITNNISDEHSVLVLPKTCLSKANFKLSKYSDGPLCIVYSKVINYFEEKRYRAEKREALITVVIFLSRVIKKEILGVTHTVNMLASTLGMSTRRVSDTLAELSSLKLISLLKEKHNGLSLPGIISIEHDFFLEFYEGFSNKDKDSMIKEIQAIKTTHINTKTNTPIHHNENPIEEYFSHLSYIANLKSKLLDILRTKETHYEVKEHIYLLLNVE